MKAIGVQHLIQKGALVELLSDWPGESYPLYALYPSRHLPAAKVRAFIDFVQSGLVQADGTADEAPGEKESKGKAIVTATPAQARVRSSACCR